MHIGIPFCQYSVSLESHTTWHTIHYQGGTNNHVKLKRAKEGKKNRPTLGFERQVTQYLASRGHTPLDEFLKKPI